MGCFRCMPVMNAGCLHVVVMSLLSAMMLFSPQASAAASDGNGPPKLLLVSFDGFRWNYPSKLPASKLPNFKAFIDKGVHVRWVENVFPTITQPNHMSMVSGLYVESHGLVHNHFYDPLLNATFPPKVLKENDSKWVDVGAEPIWVTNSKAGGERSSGSIYWPSSTAKIKGHLPDKLKLGFWDDITPEEKVDLAFEWLAHESDPANFVAMYFGNPDHMSHVHGPDSQEVLDIIISRDKIVGKILSKIQEKGLEDKLNVIITADHGHAPVYNQTMINLDLLVDPSLYKTYQKVQDGRAVVMLTPNEGFFDKVVDGLKHRNLHVAIKGKSKDMVDLHYSNNVRIPPIVLYGEQGWIIGTNKTTFLSGKGEHGWDPRYAPSMYPFFMASGPAFKKGVRNEAPFHIVDMYSLMCHVLGLTPAPNNGSLSNTAHILSASVSTVTTYIEIVIGILVVIVAVVIILFIIRSLQKKKNITASYKRTFTEESSRGMMAEGVVEFKDEDL